MARMTVAHDGPVGQLTGTRERVLILAGQGRLDRRALCRVADVEAIAAFDLRPMPTDPAAHVRAGYAFMRPYLERLAQHDPAAAVSVTSEDGYTYTFRPRTVLRRVLDHALDHLNQVEQWVVWQATGAAPTPTDGWASSADALEEDALPLTPADLDAWLWRIDLVWTLLAQRAAQLSPAQLDWIPPDGGWSLRRVLHHVARGFYVVWLDDALSDDPVARYAEASRRLQERLDRVLAAPPDPTTAFYGREARAITPEEAAVEALAAERLLLESASAAPRS